MKLKKRNFCFALIGLILLSACYKREIFDTPSNYDKIKKSGIIGGLKSAVGDFLTSDGGTDKRGRVLQNAVHGSHSSVLSGNQLDKQESDLRRDMESAKISFKNTGDQLIVSLPQDILFSIDSTSLRSDLIADLHTLSNNLRSYPDTGIQVVGHTDNTGAASYNHILSAGFAESISRVLLNNGVDPSRIMTLGRGEDQPTVSNLTAQERSQNRRVEIVILPKAVSG